MHQDEGAATVKRVAELAGCSPRVAAAVLSPTPGTVRVGEATRERVLEAAREVGYRPHLAARMMRSGRSQQVGVLILESMGGQVRHPALFEMILGINEGLERAGYLMSLVRASDVEQENLLSARLFEGRLLDGLIVASLLPSDVVPKVEAMMPQCVWLDTDVWQPERCIRRDEEHAGRLTVQAMAALGYKKLLVVEREREVTMHYSFAQRLRGVEEEAHEQQVLLERFYLPPGWHGHAELGDLLRLLSPEVGVVTLDAYGAQKIAMAASSVGLQAGYGYGLACCDDVEHSTEAQWPGLCRVSFDRYSMGVQAAEMMLRALGHTPGDCNSRLLRGQWLVGNTAWGPQPREVPFGANR